MMKELPNKLHELLVLALEDEDRAFNSPNYRINMDDWHVPDITPHGICEVCLAGAVMAFSLDADIEKNMVPGDLEPDLNNKLQALDSLRCGFLCSAAEELGANLPKYKDFDKIFTKKDIPRSVYVHDYDCPEDRDAWRKDMQDILAILKAHDL